MKLLFCGDVVGKPGREAVLRRLPTLRQKWGLDWVVVNVENSAHGFGVTPEICQDFYAAGADVLTTGNHVWAQRTIVKYIHTDPRLLRPMNFPKGTPGSGIGLVTHPKTQKKLVVLHVMTRLFMELVDDPFAALAEALETYVLSHREIGAILVDIHGEATSEKMALAHCFDGRVSLVVGTHTHIPTADAQIFPGGTAFQSDAGMCGDYDSVIGMEKMNAVLRFRIPSLAGRLSPAEKEGTLCGVYLETDDQTGLAVKILPVRLGGRLQSTTIPALS